jgi:hypothetical protein
MAAAADATTRAVATIRAVAIVAAVAIAVAIVSAVVAAAITAAVVPLPAVQLPLRAAAVKTRAVAIVVAVIAAVAVRSAASSVATAVATVVAVATRAVAIWLRLAAAASSFASNLAPATIAHTTATGPPALKRVTIDGKASGHKPGALLFLDAMIPRPMLLGATNTDRLPKRWPARIAAKLRMSFFQTASCAHAFR